MEEKELWMEKIRGLAPVLEKAEIEVHNEKANLQRLMARLKTEAIAHGNKSVASQETYAENKEVIYQARLNVGIAQGHLMSVKVQIDALKIGFEEWRTKKINEREERKRYDGD